MQPDPLATERSALEQTIARLESDVLARGARLDLERAAGRRPRGFVVGVAIGAVIAVAFIATCIIVMLGAIGRLD